MPLAGGQGGHFYNTNNTKNNFTSLVEYYMGPALSVASGIVVGAKRCANSNSGIEVEQVVPPA